MVLPFAAFFALTLARAWIAHAAILPQWHTPPGERVEHADHGLADRDLHPGGFQPRERLALALDVTPTASSPVDDPARDTQPLAGSLQFDPIDAAMQYTMRSGQFRFRPSRASLAA